VVQARLGRDRHLLYLNRFMLTRQVIRLFASNLGLVGSGADTPTQRR